jgi:uncharacterized protein
MTSFLSGNPFVAAGMIEDPRLFVGRKEQINAIVSRMSGVQPTSINVVGEKRIGKSSLLYHFFLTWEQRVQEPSRYVVIYLSLQSVQCQHETNFYQAVAQELLSRTTVQAKQTVCDLLQKKPLERFDFSRVIAECKQQGILPVLCLDDFKELFENKSEFNDSFYDNLRSLMDNSSLMLVIATTKRLDVYSKKHQLTSSFFNLGHTLKLDELTEEEATDLARLPASTVKGATSALGMHEQKLMRQLGGNHPFLLQKAGILLWEAQQQGKDESWVKRKFAEGLKLTPKSQKNFLRLTLRVIWDLPVFLGKVPKFIGGISGNAFAWLGGLAILFFLYLVIKGDKNSQQLLDFVLHKLGLK